MNDSDVKHKLGLPLTRRVGLTMQSVKYTVQTQDMVGGARNADTFNLFTKALGDKCLQCLVQECLMQATSLFPHHEAHA